MENLDMWVKYILKRETIWNKILKGLNVLVVVDRKAIVIICFAVKKLFFREYERCWACLDI
jgi:hypothetical protein